MGKLPLGSVASILVIVMAFGFLTTALGTGNAYAGGEEETLKPVGGKTVAESEEARSNVVWFVLGFLVAVFLTAL